MLNISEVFDTIQGEAAYTGTPSWFIRLQGCDVGCPFCDTKYTWTFGSEGSHPATLDESRVRLDELMARLTKGDVYKADPTIKGLSIDGVHLIDLLKEKRGGIKHIVITGGEPMAQAQAVDELARYATTKGYSVQIETSGTYPIQLPSNIWVTVSPKIGMAGKRKVLKDSVLRADEIKFPIGKAEDVEKLTTLLADCQVPDYVPVWLQPLSMGTAATTLCIQTAMDRGWKLSLQTHKFIGLA